MAVTEQMAADYLGISTDDPNLPLILGTAITLVEEDLGTSGMLKIPTDTYDIAVLTAADQLWRRRNSAGGMAVWGPDGGQAIFLPNDVLKPVRPLYQKYRSLGVPQ